MKNLLGPMRVICAADTPDDLKSRLDRDGVAITGRVVPTESLAVLREEFDRVMAMDGGRAGTRSALGASSLFRTLADTSIREIACATLGASAFVARSLLFDKRAGSNWDVTWHRDTTIAVREKRETDGYGPWSIKAGLWHVRPPVRVLEKMLTARLHLDDCDESNGALLVVPASHRALPDLNVRVDHDECRRQAVCCAVQAGGVLLMRPLILHASMKAIDAARRRRVLHLEFAADALEGDLQWAYA